MKLEPVASPKLLVEIRNDFRPVFFDDLPERSGGLLIPPHVTKFPLLPFFPLPKPGGWLVIQGGKGRKKAFCTWRGVNLRRGGGAYVKESCWREGVGLPACGISKLFFSFFVFPFFGSILCSGRRRGPARCVSLPCVAKPRQFRGSGARCKEFIRLALLFFFFPPPTHLNFQFLTFVFPISFFGPSSCLSLSSPPPHFGSSSFPWRRRNCCPKKSLGALPFPHQGGREREKRSCLSTPAPKKVVPPPAAGQAPLNFPPPDFGGREASIK